MLEASHVLGLKNDTRTSAVAKRLIGHSLRNGWDNELGGFYDEGFKKMWQYIQTYIVDHDYGDWYEEGLGKEPQRKTALKGHIWKATYHQSRALLNCIERLRR